MQHNFIPQDIFLDFANPELRRSLGFDNTKSNLTRDPFDSAMMAAFFACKNKCILPPTFIVEWPYLSNWIKNHPLILESNLVCFPMRQRTVDSFAADKLNEYGEELEVHPGLSNQFAQQKGFSILHENSLSITPRLLRVGAHMASQFLCGADCDRHWVRYLNVLSNQDQKHLQQSASYLRELGKPVTTTALRGLKALSKIPTDILFDLTHRAYCKTYTTEYNCDILHNVYRVADLSGLSGCSIALDFHFWSGLFRIWNIGFESHWTDLIVSQISSSQVRFALLEVISDAQNKGLRCNEILAIAAQHKQGIRSKWLRLHDPVMWLETKMEQLVDSVALQLKFNTSNTLNPKITQNNEFNAHKKLQHKRLGVTMPHIAIFAALSEEAHVFRELLQLNVHEPDGLSLGKIGDIRVSLYTPNRLGRVPAAVQTMKFLQENTPDMIIVAGIAGGFKSKGVNLGDILAPQFVFDVGSTKTYKESSDEDISESLRTEPFRLDPRLSNYLKSGSFNIREWANNAARYVQNESYLPKIHIDPICCGDTVVANEKWPDRVLLVNDKICGVEMEAGGVCAAAELYKVPVAVLRGVSDHATPLKSDNEWRRIALRSVGHLLSTISFEVLL